jgi:hypothetical protein
MAGQDGTGDGPVSPVGAVSSARAAARRRIALAPWPAWVAGGTSLAMAGTLLALAVALAGDEAAFGAGELIRGETPAFFTLVIGGAGLLALLLSLAFGANGGVGVAVALLLGGWAVTLIGAGPVLRVDFVLAGAAHVVVAELAFWSIGRRTPAGADQSGALATRAAELAGLLVLAVGVGWVLTGAVGAIGGGAALDLLGVAVVVAFGAVVVALVRRA